MTNLSIEVSRVPARWRVSLERLEASDCSALLDFCDYLVFTFPDFWKSRRRYLDLVGNPCLKPAMKVAAGLANGLARAAFLGVNAEDRLACLDALLAFRALTREAMGLATATVVPPRRDGDDPESEQDTVRSRRCLSDLPAAEFVFRVHEVILGRSCRPSEMLRWRADLERGQVSREAFLNHAFEEVVRIERHETERSGSTAEFHIMGTGQRVTETDWRARAQALVAQPALHACARNWPQHLFIKSSMCPLVSVVTSLYRGREHIERFLSNMVAQTCFDSLMELIVVDAASPDGEGAIIERYAASYPNIHYLRQPRRIGIYEAWNLALSQARGLYVTNANVDDLRRNDSIELQAATLDNLGFVDIVYQDFYYTMDPTLGYDRVAALGFKSTLPLIGAEVLMSYNPPHHAPMWRKRLHNELGLFDPAFQSAGDYEFWLRCLAAGKTFFKLDDPHVVYFQNPKGMSTRPATRGQAEANEALRRHGRRLVSPMLALNDHDFPLAVSRRVRDGLPRPGSGPLVRARWLDAALRAVSDRAYQ